VLSKFILASVIGLFVVGSLDEAAASRFLYEGNLKDSVAYYRRLLTPGTLRQWDGLYMGCAPIRALWFQNSHLGVIRLMRMSRNGRAFTVSNYADAKKAHDQLELEKVADAKGICHTPGEDPLYQAPLNTVGMIYRRGEIEFSAYDAGGLRADSVVLDQEKVGGGIPLKKFVPAACVACHGGEPVEITRRPGADPYTYFMPMDFNVMKFLRISGPIGNQKFEFVYNFNQISVLEKYRIWQMNRAVALINDELSQRRSDGNLQAAYITEILYSDIRDYRTGQMGRVPKEYRDSPAKTTSYDRGPRQVGCVGCHASRPLKTWNTEASLDDWVRQQHSNGSLREMPFSEWGFRRLLHERDTADFVRRWLKGE